MLVDFGIVLFAKYAQRFCNAKQNARADNFFQKKAEPGIKAVNRAINLGFFFWSPARRNNIFKISGPTRAGLKKRLCDKLLFSRLF